MILNSYSWYHDSKIWTSPSLFLSNMTLMYWESVNADRQVLGGWRYKQAKCCCIQEGTRIHTCCWVVASYLISWSLVNYQSITAWFEVTLYHNYHFQSAYSHKHSERSKRCLLWAGAKNPWQNSKAWYSDTCGGLECKGWGSTRWWRRSDRPPPMTWERSENGQHFVKICASNHMVIASNHMVIATTLFPHKYIHKHTWVSQGACTKNQFMMLPGNCKPRRARPWIWYRAKRRSYTTSCISCRSKNKYWRTGKGDWWWNCQRKATLPNAKIGEA